MKQKIIMKVQMNCEKCRTKAMRIAAVAEGVISVAIEGGEKDRIVVIGDEVDSASLTRCLRKKLGYATLVSVEEVKEKDQKGKDDDGKDDEGKDDKGKEDKSTPDPTPNQWTTTCCQNPQFFIAPMDYPNQTICSIM